MKYRILRTAFAGGAVLTGAVYLWGGEQTLFVVLPLLAACFWGIFGASLSEAREAGSRGESGFVRWLPAVGAALVAGFASLGTALWFIG